LREKGYDARTEETQYEGEIGELEAKSEIDKDLDTVSKTPESL
jgi:putative mRNA 3-end processing factor